MTVNKYTCDYYVTPNKLFGSQEMIHKKKCFKLSPNISNISGFGFDISEYDFVPEICRIHVPFSDKNFGKKAHCKCKTFALEPWYQNRPNSQIPHIIGYRMLSPDPNIERKAMYHPYIYLIQESYLTDIIDNPESAETNICPCIIESTNKGHGGTIIIGTKSALKKVIDCQQIFYKENIAELKKLCNDTCEILLSIQLSELSELISTKKFYIHTKPDGSSLIMTFNPVLEMVVSALVSDRLIEPRKNDLYLLVGINHYQATNSSIEQIFLDVSHGKRKLNELPKECAVRELKEEFAIEMSPEDFDSEYYLCSTHFYLREMVDNIPEDIITGITEIKIDTQT